MPVASSLRVVLQSASDFDHHLPPRIRAGLGLAAVGLAASGTGRCHGRIDIRATARCGLILDGAPSRERPTFGSHPTTARVSARARALYPPRASQRGARPWVCAARRLNCPDPLPGGRRPRGRGTRALRDRRRHLQDARATTDAGLADQLPLARAFAASRA